MRKHIYRLSCLLILASCSGNQNNEDNWEFKNDETAFIHSLEIFRHTQLETYNVVGKNQKFLNEYKSNKDSIAVMMVRYKKEILACCERYNTIVEESKKVSDNYLDYIHPQLKDMYRNKFIECMKLTSETMQNGINDKFSDSVLTNAAEKNKKMDEMLLTFWSYISSIQGDIQSKRPELKQAIIKILSE